ncbi:hypothetical protein B5M42_017455 [Paenibacillus athensensis]|uniref:Uncharacterized protein n=1 Tax=Paenibacillus athensensis TaxID=1967502 RepID=A0A4Y8PX34_9BACL|nr:beta-ketoacyl synthase N-terminal-like domain-containing protein [Paenibacillus athensensis]MCD1260592.1 hypothetical protein [Paenibacillus athensensis]
MDKLEKLIFEKVAAGKIDRDTAADMLIALKQPGRRRAKDIAVIGVSLRMPQADRLESFWEGIRSRREQIRPYPETRQKDVKGFILNYTDLQEEQVQFSHGGFLDEVDGFDYGFFNLSPKEASVMDPNQRLFLEAAWSAIEDAGYGGGKLSGTRTGVYVGYADWPVYGQYISKMLPELIQTAGVGNTPSIIASRISYLLDLKGPAFLVDTACSSSLVAVHLACAAIKNGECDLALAGGVKVCLMPVDGVFEIGIESSNHKTSAFDDSSDGTVWGEGTVALLLKPLERALADNDQIYAVLKGSAINQDGASVGITAPNAEAQEQVLAQAWEEAGIAPETITYFEAHGTGTKLGDPIEIDGIQRAFRRYTGKKQFCAIGSVKTNIGHLDGASGIAGLAKAIAALRYKELPPTINFTRPNRKIAFESSPVYVNDRLRDWEPATLVSGEAAPRRCGVSSFGFSGTNAHVVLEEAPLRPDAAEAAGAAGTAGAAGVAGRGPHVLALSAKTKPALEALVDAYRAFLRADAAPRAVQDAFAAGAAGPSQDAAASGDDTRLRDICYTANTGRGHYSWRAAIVAADRASLLARLDELAADGLAASAAAVAAASAEPGAVGSVSCGEHRVVTLRREQRQPGELTTGEMRELSEQAAELLTAAGARDAAQLERLCRLYVQGAQIDWELLYAGEARRKRSVPLYPFQRTRCWIDVDAIDAAREREQAALAQAAAGQAAGETPSAAGPQALASAPAVALKGRADGAYTPLELQLAAVWGQLLGHTEIDVDDDFFELGGNSILAIRLEVDLERLGLRILSEDLYRVRSLRELASHLAGEPDSGVASSSAFAAAAEPPAAVAPGVAHPAAPAPDIASPTAPSAGPPAAVAPGVARPAAPAPDIASPTAPSAGPPAAVGPDVTRPAAPAPDIASPTAPSAGPPAAVGITPAGTRLRVVLDGIEPFNDVFYRNCFYNSMFPIALSYGESILPFLVNDRIVYTHAEGRYRIDYESLQPIERIFAQAGLGVDTFADHDGVVEALIAGLDAGQPAIVWVDSFYESIRRDAYGKEHFDHTLLVYGYDRTEKLFYLIEHDRRENLSYKPLTLPFEDMALACAGFMERFYSEDQPIARYAFEHLRLAPDPAQQRAAALRSFAHNLSEGRGRLTASLHTLSAFIEDYRQATASGDSLQPFTQPFVDFLNDVLNAKQVERYRLTLLLGEDSEPVRALQALTQKWDYVRKGMVRFLYMPVYKPETFAAGYARLSELPGDEERFHQLVAAELDKHIKQLTY